MFSTVSQNSIVLTTCLLLAFAAFSWASVREEVSRKLFLIGALLYLVPSIILLAAGVLALYEFGVCREMFAWGCAFFLADTVVFVGLVYMFWEERQESDRHGWPSGKCHEDGAVLWGVIEALDQKGVLRRQDILDSVERSEEADSRPSAGSTDEHRTAGTDTGTRGWRAHLRKKGGDGDATSTGRGEEPE